MPPIEWDVFAMLPGSTPPSYLATLYEAREKSIRVVLDGTGEGSFSINRGSPECTEAILAQGNLVKVRIPEIHTGYLFGFFLETGDFTLISSDEAGGEMLHFGGPGNLSYLGYACAWSASYIAGGQGPIDGIWRAYAAGTGNKPGQILRRMLEEFQDPDRPQHPLPHLTIDFDYSVDSDAETWVATDATAEFSYQAGDDGLAILERLLETRRITVQMGADFDLHAYNSYGRDLTGGAFGAGVVRFTRGVNIATELRRSREPTSARTHMLVAGEKDKYARAVDTAAGSQVTKEGYVAAFGEGSAALVGIGQAEIRARKRTEQVITFPINNRRTAVSLSDPVTVGAVQAIPGVATSGFYLPGPPGTNGDFWLGDIVRLHTGSGPFDFNEVDARVTAITIARDDDNAELVVIPELEELDAASCPDVDPTPSGYYPAFLPFPVPEFDSFARTPGDLQHYTKGGVPDPDSVLNAWNYPGYRWAGGSHSGLVDIGISASGNLIFLYPKGDRRLTLYTVNYYGGAGATFRVRLLNADGSLIETVGSNLPMGTPYTFDVSFARDGLCEHFIEIGEWYGGPAVPTNHMGWDGLDVADIP